MPFWKKVFQKQQDVYYPQAVVQGKPVETETIAKDLAKISTVSNSDVQAVLGDNSSLMHTRRAKGKSVHIKELDIMWSLPRSTMIWLPKGVLPHLPRPQFLHHRIERMGNMEL